MSEVKYLDFRVAEKYEVRWDPNRNGYFVGTPNWQGGTVVMAETFDKMVELYNEDGMQIVQLCFKLDGLRQSLKASIASDEESLEMYRRARDRADVALADNTMLRNALAMARECLPSLDSLPKTPTRIREVVEAVDAALGARG